MIDQGCGRDLGHALQRNTVVVTIDLSPVHLVASETELERNDMTRQPKLIAERMELLLHWMEHSCSLRAVVLYTGWREPLAGMLLEKILDALAKHKNIRFFESQTSEVSLSVLTPFLQANTSLQSLKIRAYTCPEADTDDIFEESARAVGAMYKLEVLLIATRQIDPFLRHLQTSAAFNTTLRGLTLDFTEPTRLWVDSVNQFSAIVLCQVLSDRSCRLERLELRNVRFDEQTWTLLSSALLWSNPSSLLRTLVLDGVEFTKRPRLSFFGTCSPTQRGRSRHQNQLKNNGNRHSTTYSTFA